MMSNKKQKFNIGSKVMAYNTDTLGEGIWLSGIIYDIFLRRNRKCYRVMLDSGGMMDVTFKNIKNILT
jgi:hypothetical protein